MNHGIILGSSCVCVSVTYDTIRLGRREPLSIDLYVPVYNYLPGTDHLKAK